eukprot:gb/GECG01005701.1/.p1 GENE.gb/GECG01005701.1/~~gb/GECG01005701.1/.p1  ORF type:complete len:947 (+),score=88.18 gb/GECG01005701.1/:1-2841(+)
MLQNADIGNYVGAITFAESQKYMPMESSTGTNTPVLTTSSSFANWKNSTISLSDGTRITPYIDASFQNREEQLVSLRRMIQKANAMVTDRFYEFPAAAQSWGTGKTQLFTHGIAAYLCHSPPKDKGGNILPFIHCYYDLSKLDGWEDLRSAERIVIGLVESISNSRVPYIESGEEVTAPNVQFRNLLNEKEKADIRKTTLDRLEKEGLLDFQYDVTSGVSDKKYEHDQRILKLCGDVIGSEFSRVLKNKYEAFRVFLVFDEFDSVAGTKHTSDGYVNPGVIYMWWHCAVALSQTVALSQNGAFLSSIIGKLPDLLRVSEGGYFRSVSVATQSPDNSELRHVYLNTLNRTHIGEIIRKDGRIPHAFQEKAAVAIHAMTAGVPRFASWALSKITEAFSNRSLANINPPLEHIGSSNRLGTYVVGIAKSLKGQPESFVATAMVWLLGIRKTPGCLLSEEGQFAPEPARVNSIVRRGFRPFIDWCRFFNFYVDYNDAQPYMLTLNFPPLLASKLWNEAEDHLTPLTQKTEVERQVYKERARFVTKCLMSLGDSPISVGNDFDNDMDSLLQLWDPQAETSSTAQPGEGYDFERALFQLMHLRLLGESFPDESRHVASVLPIPLSIRRKTGQGLLYSPWGVRVMRLPQFVIENEGNQESLNEALRLLSPSPFLAPGESIPRVHIDHWDRIWGVIKGYKNVVLKPGDGSVGADFTFYLPPNLWAYQVKLLKEDLSLDQLFSEFERALPERLREASKGVNKIFVVASKTLLHKDVVSTHFEEESIGFVMRPETIIKLQPDLENVDECTIVLLRGPDLQTLKMCDVTSVQTVLSDLYFTTLAAREAHTLTEFTAVHQQMVSRKTYPKPVGGTRHIRTLQSSQLGPSNYSANQLVTAFKNGLMDEARVREVLEGRLMDLGGNIYTNRGTRRTLPGLEKEIQRKKRQIKARKPGNKR